MPSPSGFSTPSAPESAFPRFMLVDMNSFFASVEQQANPFYRGRPIGVCGSLHRGSSLIAASKEAKVLGIGTGTPNWKARQVCPDIIMVQAEPAKYRQVNRMFNRILEDYSDRIEHYSIDESFLDLRDSAANPLAMAAEIKRRIRAEVGEYITCSVGLGQNRFLSKMASGLQKPDGLTVIWRSQLKEVYKKLGFRDLWGLNRGWERRLNQLGMSGPADLLDYPLANIVAAYGKPGYYIWNRVNGLEVDEIATSGQEEEAPKSFGHSWVLNFRSREKLRIEPVIMRLAEKAARRMRRGGFKARGVYVTISEASGRYHHQSKRLQYDVTTGTDLYQQAKVIWKDWEFLSEVSKVAVGFFDLVSHQEQPPLFGHGDRELNESIDTINDKYGEFTIRSGLLAETADYAPDAIAFGK